MNVRDNNIVPNTGLTAGLERVWGQKGLGQHWLAFNVRLRVRTPESIEVTGCQLLAHVGGHVLGKTVWTVPAWLPHKSQDDGAPVELKLPLTADQVVLLDELRDVRGSIRLKLWLDVHFRRTKTNIDEHHVQASSSTCDFSAELEQSDWTRIHKEMGFEERLVFEVPVAGGRLPAVLAKAGESLKTARVAFSERRWEDVLLRCRDVIDEIEHQKPPPPPPAGVSKRNLSLEQRLAAVVQAVRFATHRGAHGAGKGAIDGTPDRTDAEFILHTTALALKSATLK